MRNSTVYSHMFDQVQIAGRFHQRFLKAEMAVDIANQNIEDLFYIVVAFFDTVINSLIV